MLWIVELEERLQKIRRIILNNVGIHASIALAFPLKVKAVWMSSKKILWHSEGCFQIIFKVVQSMLKVQPSLLLILLYIVFLCFLLYLLEFFLSLLKWSPKHLQFSRTLFILSYFRKFLRGEMKVLEHLWHLRKTKKQQRNPLIKAFILQYNAMVGGIDLDRQDEEICRLGNS